jgi:hypothetical protein
MSDNTVHVYPLNDVFIHSTDTPWCDCHPRLEPYDSALLVIHNSWDGREITERALDTAFDEGRN